MDTIVEEALVEMYDDIIEESMHTVMRRGQLITPERRAELSGRLADDVNLVKTTFNTIANDREMIANHGWFVVVKQSQSRVPEDRRKMFWENIFDMLDQLFRIDHDGDLHKMIWAMRTHILTTRKGISEDVTRGLLKHQLKPILISLVDKLSEANLNGQMHRQTNFRDMW